MTDEKAQTRAVLVCQRAAAKGTGERAVRALNVRNKKREEIQTYGRAMSERKTRTCKLVTLLTSHVPIAP